MQLGQHPDAGGKLSPERLGGLGLAKCVGLGIAEQLGLGLGFGLGERFRRQLLGRQRQWSTVALGVGFGRGGWRPADRQDRL